MPCGPQAERRIPLFQRRGYASGQRLSPGPSAVGGRERAASQPALEPSCSNREVPGSHPRQVFAGTRNRLAASPPPGPHGPLCLRVNRGRARRRRAGHLRSRPGNRRGRFQNWRPRGSPRTPRRRLSPSHARNLNASPAPTPQRGRARAAALLANPPRRPRGWIPNADVACARRGGKRSFLAQRSRDGERQRLPATAAELRPRPGRRIPSARTPPLECGG